MDKTKLLAQGRKWLLYEFDTFFVAPAPRPYAEFLFRRRIVAAFAVGVIALFAFSIGYLQAQTSFAVTNVTDFAELQSLDCVNAQYYNNAYEGGFYIGLLTSLPSNSTLYPATESASGSLTFAPWFVRFQKPVAFSKGSVSSQYPMSLAFGKHVTDQQLALHAVQQENIYWNERLLQVVSVNGEIMNHYALSLTPREPDLLIGTEVEISVKWMANSSRCNPSNPPQVTQLFTDRFNSETFVLGQCRITWKPSASMLSDYDSDGRYNSFRRSNNTCAESVLVFNSTANSSQLQTVRFCDPTINLADFSRIRSIVMPPITESIDRQTLPFLCKHVKQQSALSVLSLSISITGFAVNVIAQFVFPLLQKLLRRDSVSGADAGTGGAETPAAAPTAADDDTTTAIELQTSQPPGSESVEALRKS